MEGRVGEQSREYTWAVHRVRAMSSCSVVSPGKEWHGASARTFTWQEDSAEGSAECAADDWNEECSLLINRARVR